MTRMSLRPTTLSLLVAGLFLATPALAGFSPKVIGAFKGQILVSGAPLTPKGSDAETIAHLKKATVTSVTCATDADSAPSTTFNVTAFLSAKPLGDLRLVIAEATSPKKKGHTTSKALSVDPNASVVETEVEVSADDVVGPKLKLTLEQGVPSQVIAAGMLEAACLKTKAAVTPLKKTPPKKK